MVLFSCPGHFTAKPQRAEALSQKERSRGRQASDKLWRLVRGGTLRAPRQKNPFGNPSPLKKALRCVVSAVLLPPSARPACLSTPSRGAYLRREREGETERGCCLLPPRLEPFCAQPCAARLARRKGAENRTPRSQWGHPSLPRARQGYCARSLLLLPGEPTWAAKPEERAPAETSLSSVSNPGAAGNVDMFASRCKDYCRCRLQPGN
ncbi:uncharacterized protein LOC134297950 [Anolis carolinensis]|uniref:uncharacterized protein LOC134297950 n=1 Tax=Anolis carolinensis TaxID=28377 RepID=UPI002F2B3AF3